MNDRRFNSTFKRKSYTWKRSEKPLGYTGRKRLTSRRPSKGKTVDGDSRRAIKDECDQLVREIVNIRDRRCFTCPRTQDLQVGHLFRRGIESLRWDLRNCNAQCERCNAQHEYDPDPYFQTFEFIIGANMLWALTEQSKSKHRFTYIELIEIRNGLRAELKRYEAARKAKAA
jgi:hypothetical protein